MSEQLALDLPQVETIRCPLCIYRFVCGHRAVLGPSVDLGGCVNRSIRCLHCGATGEESTRTDNT